MHLNVEAQNWQQCCIQEVRNIITGSRKKQKLLLDDFYLNLGSYIPLQIYAKGKLVVFCKSVFIIKFQFALHVSALFTAIRLRKNTTLQPMFQN
jgi:hypothetical protein